jgi:hypothetical protein
MTALPKEQQVHKSTDERECSRYSSPEASGESLTIGVFRTLRSQWKAPKKGEAELNEAYWKYLAKCHLGSTSASPIDTSYRVITYLA